LAEPPSAPQNLTVNFVDQSTVALSWSPPENLGGRIDIAYRIKCDACTLGLVQYNPHTVRTRKKKQLRENCLDKLFQETFNDTRVTISGLNAVTTYRFQIFAENGVSFMRSKQSPEYADVTVTTEALVASSITNVRVTSVMSSEITLAWDAPPTTDGNDLENDLVETYEVRWFPRSDIDYSNSTSLLTTELSTTITGLQQRTEYGLQVRAKTQRGWGAYSPVIFKTTGQVLNTGKS
jgi:Eph receptor B1